MINFESANYHSLRMGCASTLAAFDIARKRYMVGQLKGGKADN